MAHSGAPVEYAHYMSQTNEAWDPETKVVQGSMSETCLMRITKDLRSICT